MSDARKWLNAAVVTDPATTVACQNALLAVLDECDKIKRTYDRGHPAVYDDFEAGLLTMMDNVVQAINKALGLDGCACGHPWDMHGPEAPGCVECECEYIREGVTNE